MNPQCEHDYEVRIALLEERLRDHKETSLRALEKQAAEYERRLNELDVARSTRQIMFQILTNIIAIAAVAAIVWGAHR
jgi:hypothetical protein